MSPPASTDAAGSKNARRCYTVLPAATVAGGRKNTQICISKLAKTMCSGKCNSPDLVLGEEHTLLEKILHPLSIVFTGL
jgi:hypothetical protein